MNKNYIKWAGALLLFISIGKVCAAIWVGTELAYLDAIAFLLLMMFSGMVGAVSGKWDS